MSTINAASSGQVRYVATLALRAGHIPAMSSVTQPVLSKQQAQQAKVKFTKTVLAATQGANGKLPATTHQLNTLVQMAAISNVTIGHPANRWVADQWQIAWFKKASPSQVVQLVSALQPVAQAAA